jgi:hypothetical protein
MALIAFTGSSTERRQLSAVTSALPGRENSIRNTRPKLISITSPQRVPPKPKYRAVLRLDPDGGCNYVRRCVARSSK